jgi:hypothetical protein
VKVKDPFMQSLAGMEIYTVTGVPAVTVPLAGLKPTPAKLLDDVHDN